MKIARLLIPLIVLVTVWGALLGAAQIRRSNDRHYCTNYTVAGADGARQVVQGLEPGCLHRREAERWGPYHLLGSNGVRGR